MEVYLIENGTDAVLWEPGTRHASLRVPQWEKIQAQFYLCYHHIPLELAIATASPSLEERFSIFKACK